MSKSIKPRKAFRRTTFKVQGSGRFPLDMLRYDTCVPFQGVTKISERGERIVSLYRFSGDGSEATADRWDSFGWDVISDTGAARK